MKSNIGHLKAAAGSGRPVQDGRALHAQDARAEPALREPQPQRRLGHDPVRRQHPAAPLAREDRPDGVRRGGVSAFGFGGTNFHVVVEEHVPGRHRPAATIFASAAIPARRRPRRGRRPPRRRRAGDGLGPQGPAARCPRARRPRRRRPRPPGPGRPRRGRRAVRRAPAAPDPALAGAAVRVAVDYGDAAELAGKLDEAAPRRSPAATRRRSGCCASRASSSGAGRPRRSPSSTPGRARSTSTCSRALREPRSRSSRDRFDEADRGDDAAARQAALRRSSSSTATTRPP